jgi:hypothetical protein
MVSKSMVTNVKAALSLAFPAGVARNAADQRTGRLDIFFSQHSSKPNPLFAIQ